MLPYAPRRELDRSPVSIGLSVMLHLVVLAILFLSARVIVSPSNDGAGPLPSFSLNEFAATAPAPSADDGVGEAADMLAPLVQTRSDLSVRSAAETAKVPPPPRPELDRLRGISAVGGNIDGQIVTPQFLLTPPYPAEKRRRGQEASLKLRLYIDAKGNVTRVSPAEGADLTFFRTAQQHIVKHWKFSPTMRDGYAVSVVKTITLDFRLTECERAQNCEDDDGQVLVQEF